MSVAASLDAQLASLRIAGPWTPPATWESIPTESGGTAAAGDRSNSGDPTYEILSISDAALVRLAIFALHGVKSAIVQIDEIAAEFLSTPADRTSNGIPNLWCRTSSTASLGKLLKSISHTGFEVLLLNKFADFFLFPTSELGLVCHEIEGKAPYSLVNQAFAVALRKLLDGYICSLTNLIGSVKLRRSAKSTVSASEANGSSGGFCAANSEFTVLEVYLHTEELRRHIKSLVNICFPEFADPAFHAENFDVDTNVKYEHFPMGADLLSYLYVHLRDADPVHYEILKYLFVCSFEPYCNFIKLWIYQARICDPFGEFLTRHANYSTKGNRLSDVFGEFSHTTMEEITCASVPCFLKDMSLPILRTGQQLQVILRILKLANLSVAGDNVYLPHNVKILEDVLPFCLHRSTSSSLPLQSWAFLKRSIGAVVNERTAFYKAVTEKLENLCSKFQVIQFKIAPDIQNSSINMLSTDVDSVHFPAKKAIINFEGDVSSDTIDEPSSEYGPSHTSDCSSTSDSEASIESEEITAAYCNFPVSDSLPPCAKSNDLCASKNNAAASQTEEHSYLRQARSPLPDCCVYTKVCQNHVCAQLGAGIQSHADGFPTELNFRLQPFKRVDNDPFRLSANAMQSYTAFHVADTTEEYITMREPLGNKCSWDTSERFCFDINPTLTKYGWQGAGDDLWDKTIKTKQIFPFFDFSSVIDPSEAYSERNHWLEDCGVEISKVGVCDLTSKLQSVAVEDRVGTCQAANFDLQLNESGAPGKHPSAYGGACWESLLKYKEESLKNITVESLSYMETLTEMPVDVVLDYCITQEIFLQYEYVSKFAVKLLEGGFDLHKHLLALRRYHFMEVADWADYFVMYFSRKKWPAAELQQRKTEIQGILNLALQKSSCNSDPCKERLFVYMKEMSPASVSMVESGWDVIDYILLGYRVDWPISIIITENALKIYAEIFCYLIQIRLAMYSLTSTWCFIKDLKKMAIRHKSSSPDAAEALNSLVIARQRLYHFVSTLQQYVHCHLADPSWCLYQHSDKHQVRDILDLESLHLAYLAEALKICFLSAETKKIAAIVRNILQCAIELQSCYKGISVNTIPGSTSFYSDSLINNIQVSAIRSKFESNLRDIFLLYLKSPKHAELGLSRFWGSLNYNEHYSSTMSRDFGCFYS